MGASSSPESPLPVRTVARGVADWVSRLGRVWVEGQLTEVSRRAGAGTVFLTLRDPVAEVSLRVTCPRAVYDGLTPPPPDGARVVIWAKPEFYLPRGALSLTAFEIRPVGVGALLARLEQLKGMLGAEGLFAAERKRPLPFLPRVIGLVCGRGSAAERDVLDHARRRWPAVRFAVREVAVQGPSAAAQIIEAVRELDRARDVDVIVITRGGGSVEDLLPFSDEALCRAIAGASTPVVSAIGHEPDTPLLDFVADLRASTPTDAGRRIVPDVAEEAGRIAALRDRGRRCVSGRLDREVALLVGLRSRPVLAAPAGELAHRTQQLVELRARARRSATGRLDAATAQLTGLHARVAALSPAATLARGYAVVQRADGQIVRRPADVAAGEGLGVRLAQGRLAVEVQAGGERG